jgi:RNA polymerase sigma factor for flagellar operon FliA
VSEAPRGRPVRLYDIGGSQLTREAVIHKYLHLVKYVAGRISIHLPSNVDLNDLINDGVFGLLDAIEKYDGSRSVKFETYAVTRINGAILDALRSLDWVPRTIRQRARELERASVARVRATALLSLEEVLPHRSGDGVPLADTLADDDSDVAFDLERDEQRAELVRAVESLPPQEQTVITLYYFKGQRLREIKAALGVSESRVSQIHSAAVAHLRHLLR